MSMIALLELALRNCTNKQISETFGDPNWLISDRALVPLEENETRIIKRAIGDAKREAYSKLSYKQKGDLDADAFPNGIPPNIKPTTQKRKRQQLLIVSQGQVLSQITFGFWKRLYAKKYEDKLWRRSLKKVFPNKNIERSEISSAIEKVYVIRNRVAHHEPVYGERLRGVIEDLSFLRNSLGAKANETNTHFQNFSRIQHLRLRMDYENFMEAWETLTYV